MVAAPRIVALPQVEDCVGRQPEPHDTGDEAGHLGKRDGLRASFRQVAPERVVEPPGGRGRRERVAGGCGRRRAFAIGAAEAELDRAAEVSRAVDVRLGQRAAEGRGGAARPEQQPHEQAHCEPERDVLDPHEADPPPLRLR